MDKKLPEVPCLFWSKETSTPLPVPVKLETALGAKMLAIRNACQDVCRSNGTPGWAQPSMQGDGVWLAFRMDGRAAHFVKAFPSEDAAAMWLQHYCAEN